MKPQHASLFGLAALAAVLASLSACGTPPASTAASRPASSAPRAVVPFSVEYGGLAIVEAEIAGKKLRLAVDSGAEKVSIGLKASALAGLELAYDGQSRGSVDIEGRKHEERSFTIPEFALGSLRLRDVAGSEDLRDFLPVDGVIGNLFLSSYAVAMDYRGLSLSLYPSGARIPELEAGKWMSIPFARGPAGMLLDCSWEGGTGLFCFDTGAAGLGIVDQAKLGASDYAADQGAGGQPKVAELRNFSIAGKGFGTQRFAALPLGSLTPSGAPFSGIVGYTILSGRRIAIDYAASRLYIDEPAP